MESVWEFMENFMESDFVKMAHIITKARLRTEPWEIWLAIILISVPMLVFFYLLITIKIESRTEKKKLAIGTYHKELPIEEIILEAGENSFQITCETETVLTPNAKEAEESKKENKQKKFRLFEGIVSEIVSKEEVCLIARSSGASAAKEDFFRLDVCPVWERKNNEEWLSRYETLRDVQGHIIAIRGADEKVTSRGYDILIPNEEADRLCAMRGEELLKFCKAENCKMQVREKGAKISFSETGGFTKGEIAEKIRRIAEKQGYKVELK